MIESLRIESWVIVDEAELEFGPGLNVVTGETGTGKSIVLGALALLAGGRASADVVRTGAERASIEAVFHTDASLDLERELERRGLAAEGHELVVHRTIAASGRGRARVAGELVPVSALADLLSDRIEISSQHSSQTLLRPDVQGRLLDEAGGLLATREAVESGVSEIRVLDADLASLRVEAEEGARRQDFLAFQVDEIDEAALAPGEIDEVTAAHARLAHAERLLTEGSAACAALVGDPDGSSAEVPSARDSVAVALRTVDGLADVDPTLSELAQRLRGCEAELDEAAADLERYLRNVEADPARLAEVEARIGVIEALRRKYGRSEEEIAAFRDRVAAELEGIECADARIDTLEARRKELVNGLEKAAAKLSRGRAKAARKLARLVEGSLGGLAMPGARFEVNLDLVEAPDGLPCGPSGAERPEFRFAADAGDPPRALSRVASGGELSRIFLAVRGALRRSGGGMVLVFDEVDAGIGGRVAERVGRALSELAQHHQVLCITHLPQIAAFGDTHFRVRKVAGARGGQAGTTRPVATVDKIDGDERIEEIARMAGGESVTDATRRHAADLLKVKHSIATV